MSLTLKFPIPPGGTDSHFIFVIPVGILGKCAEAARQRFPEEACGVILAKDGECHWMMAENRSKRPRESYRFGRGAMKTLDKLRDEGWALRAVWHSHPTGEIGLSQGDRRVLAPGGNYANPDVVQIVVSLFEPAQPAMTVTAWQWDEGARIFRPARIYATATEDSGQPDLLTEHVDPIA